MNPNNEPPRVVLEENSNWGAVKYYHESSAPKMIQWVTKYSGGLVKDANQAAYVLVGLAIIAFGISFYLFFGGGPTQPKIPATVLEQMKRMPVNR